MNEAEARQLLAVEESASAAELKSAYRRTLKTCHPDLFDPDSAAYAEAMSNTQSINAAYQLLGGKGETRREVVADEPPLPDWIKNPILTSRSETILVWSAVVVMVMVVIVQLVWFGR